jgi:hypothetical protein
MDRNFLRRVPYVARRYGIAAIRSEEEFEQYSQWLEELREERSTTGDYSLLIQLVSLVIKGYEIGVRPPRRPRRVLQRWECTWRRSSLLN